MPMSRTRACVAALAISVAALAPRLALAERTVETLGDWSVVCETPNSDARVCAATHQVLTAPNEQSQQSLLMRLVVTYNSDSNESQMMTIVPLGVDLIKGLTLEVDQGDVLRLPVKTCDQAGCRIRARVEGNFVDLMKRGAQIFVGYWPSNSEKRLRIAGSLRGFTAAYGRLLN